jgi:hypothetical protein
MGLYSAHSVRSGTPQVQCHGDEETHKQQARTRGAQTRDEAGPGDADGAMCMDDPPDLKCRTAMLLGSGPSPLTPHDTILSVNHCFLVLNVRDH